MKRLILRLMVAIVAFGFGLLTYRVFIARQPDEPLKVQEPEVKVEVRYVYVPAPTPSPEPAPAFHDYDVEKFDPSGIYRIVGPTPKILDDFSLLELWRPAGASIHSRGKNQKAIFALVTQRRVFIVTDTGIEGDFGYRFDGQFLYKNLEAFAGKRKPVLRGILTKTKNGKAVAESLVSFWLEQHWGC